MDQISVNGIAISAENALEQIKLANTLRKIGIENIRFYKFVTEEEYPRFVRQEIIVNAVTIGHTALAERIFR